ncbi:hypothetical protein K8089_12730 [Aequorivita sp. F47161]|uniref:CDP-Glycerol:Poly(Glycerophosphate) glycerophosphotransferase n=1 Tax=Aequorivita vitellina TaxID=2874475 RepID=A0A9X1QVX8_9FLAO|nr:hypothetical protein [Aequorivita vitellina]MCG2419888.1 hypothetical protein [Aequorivita vitellina]
MTSTSKKLAVVITDGVGFRNFVLSDFFVEAAQNFEEVVILSCLPASVYTGVTECRIIELDVFEEHFFTWFFRKTKEVVHLQNYKKGNFGITDNLNTNKSKSKSPRGYATRFIFKITSLFHSEKWISFFHKLQQNTFKNKSITNGYLKILEKEKPDQLFFTHQRPPYIAPLVYAAHKLNINTLAFIFSWDNLASKGRMAADFKNYMVWSELMKSDLLRFYKNVKAEAIEVVGTPQFEPYVLSRYASTLKEFQDQFSLKADLQTVCFSCGDISTSKNDELYIETIAEALQQGQLPQFNFIVRTSPAEDPIRFKEISAKYPFIIWNYPDWKISRHGHQEAWSQRVPCVDDVKRLRAILEFSDISINMLSTMSLDFMQFDKPVINPVFGTENNGLYNDGRFLNYEHIEHVVKSNATKIAKNKTELIEAIQFYLANPNANHTERQLLLAQQIGKPLKGTSERIAKTLRQWV